MRATVVNLDDAQSPVGLSVEQHDRILEVLEQMSVQYKPSEIVPGMVFEDMEYRGRRYDHRMLLVLEVNPNREEASCEIRLFEDLGPRYGLAKRSRRIELNRSEFQTSRYEFQRSRWGIPRWNTDVWAIRD